VFLTAAIPAHAQTRERIQVEPAFQEYVITENMASISGKIKVANLTSTNQTFQVYAADIQQYDADGKVTLSEKPLTGTEYSLADFIRLESSSSAIPSQESAELSFTIRNSPDLQPGGHYSALIVRAQPSQTATDQQVLPAISSFLLVRKVGGEHFNLSLLPTTVAQQTFSLQLPKVIELTFNNQGNTHLTPRGTISVTDIFGRQTHKGIINENSVFVLPSTQRQVPVRIQTMQWSFPVMLYTISITGNTAPGDITFKETSSFIYVHPLVLVIATGLLLLLIVMMIKRRVHEKL